MLNKNDMNNIKDKWQKFKWWAHYNEVYVASVLVFGTIIGCVGSTLVYLLGGK